MSFESYLEIVRSMFLDSFGHVSEALVSEFFNRGILPVPAAYLIGEGLGPEMAAAEML